MVYFREATKHNRQVKKLTILVENNFVYCVINIKIRFQNEKNQWKNQSMEKSIF